MEWNSIPEFSSYSASDSGLIKNNKTNRVLKARKSYDGYSRVNIVSDNGKSVTVQVHRIVLISFRPVDGYKHLTVDHINWDESDNRLENLRWATTKENSQHRVRCLYNIRKSKNPYYDLIKKYGKETADQMIINLL